MTEHNTIVRQIMIAVLELKPDVIIEDISMSSLPAWDSMRQISIITGLENEFGIFVEAEEANKLTTFEKIISFIDKHPDID